MHEETQLTQLDPLVDFPPELVIELAVGIDTFDNICRKHGYNTSQIEFLRNSPVLQRRVAATDSELTRDGVTHKFRSSYVSDVALKVMHQRLLDPATPTGQVIDIYKETVKTADLLPKNNQVAQQGGGYSLIINLPQVGDQPGRTIEARTKPIETVPDLGTTIPTLGTSVNSVDEGLVDVEALLDKAPLETVNRDVNRVLNSAIELPEDWDE